VQSVFSFPVLVIACAGDRVVAGRFRRVGGRIACDRCHEEILASGGAEDWVGRVCATLPRVRAAMPPARRAIIVLPAEATVLKHLQVPRVARAKQEQILRFEAEQAVPAAGGGLVWDFLVTGGNATQENRVLGVAKLEVLERLVDAVVEQGWAVERVVPAFAGWLAVLRAGDGPAGRTLLADVAPPTATVLQSNGAQFAIRVFPVGDAITEAGMARLAQEITRTVLHFQRHHELQEPERVGLLADAERDGAMQASLQERLGWPVQPFDEVFGCEWGAGSAAGCSRRDRVTLAGAAAVLLNPKLPSMDLTPPRVRHASRLRGDRCWLLAAAVLAVAALLPPAIHFHGKSLLLRADLAALTERLESRRTEVALGQARVRELAAIREETKWLGSVARARVGWISFLGDLQGRLGAVEDAWLDTLQAPAAVAGQPRKILVTGRVLDRENPESRLGPAAVTRVRALLADLAESPFVTALENERFDPAQPGVIGFGVTLVIKPGEGL
jgi:type IV pilus assembly protein PilM